MCKSRQSNFELLRILAILMVVMGHFIRQSGLLESEAGANGTINIFLGSGGRIAVNLFLLIGSWFMVDSVFRPAKALKLYLETAFYCIPITILLACLGMAGGAQNIMQGLLPFFGRPVWFASAYISLILLTPFLNMAFLLPFKKQTCLIGALFVLYCIASTIPCFSNIDYIADFSWFCVLYLTVGWLKKNNLINKANISRWGYLLMSILIYVGLCICVTIPFLSWTSNYWLDNIRSLPNLLCAFCLFVFFLKTDIGAIRPINFLARSVFAVYIIHQIPAFREIEWKTICRAESLSGAPTTTYALAILGVAISILIAVTLIDTLRIALFSAVESRVRKGRDK